MEIREAEGTDREAIHTAHIESFQSREPDEYSKQE